MKSLTTTQQHVLDAIDGIRPIQHHNKRHDAAVAVLKSMGIIEKGPDDVLRRVPSGIIDELALFNLANDWAGQIIGDVHVATIIKEGSPDHWLRVYYKGRHAYDVIKYKNSVVPAYVVMYPIIRINLRDAYNMLLPVKK